MTRGTVLVVDDDPDIREAIIDLLDGVGYAAVGSADGACALEELRRGLHPCAILLDLMMPGMNGWQFHDEVVREPDLARIPVIVMSGDAETERKAAHLGIGEVLKKPFDPDALFAVVGRHCR